MCKYPIRPAFSRTNVTVEAWVKLDALASPVRRIQDCNTLSSRKLLSGIV